MAVAEGTGLKAFGSGGFVHPGPSDGLRGIASAVGTGVDNGAGKSSSLPPPPKGVATIEKLTLTDDVGAERIVMGLHGRFRLCYNQGLALDPGMSGQVTMSARVSPNGEVSSVVPVGNAGLSDSVLKCIARALKNASFGSSPLGLTLQVPVKFVKAQ